MKILVVRLGAIGDSVITTPLIRYLHNQGNEVYVLTSEIGALIYDNNPHIVRVKTHPRDSIPMEALDAYFESHRQAWGCDKLIDLCESIEVNLSLYPSSPRYKYPLYERKEICDKNFYEETFRKAGVGGDEYFMTECAPPQEFFIPEMFFTPQEETEMAKFFSQFKGKFVVLWALSGSARSKVYPYWEQAINLILQKYPDAIVITCGDDLCKILERPFNNKRIIKKSGEWSIRQSILACKYASCVISPDTGILHGSGCFDTPKIGLFTHTTINNVSNHFKNDYSIECDHELVSCSPCFWLVYLSKVQCNLMEDGQTPLCMGYGIPPGKILGQISKVRNG